MAYLKNTARRIEEMKQAPGKKGSGKKVPKKAASKKK